MGTFISTKNLYEPSYFWYLFHSKLMHHLKPFAIVVLNGEITVYSVDSPNGLESYIVGQLIQNLVWIFPNGSTANTKPCLDTSKWWINGPSKTIWMVVQLAANTVQMVSPCVYKTNGHFWKWKFWMVLNGLSVGGLTYKNLYFESPATYFQLTPKILMALKKNYFLSIKRWSQNSSQTNMCTALRFSAGQGMW